jgi:lysophospholipid acyltransferase (LPLAT)-like uncharacterized protein
MPDDALIEARAFDFDPDLFAIRERDLLVIAPLGLLTKAIALVAEGKDGDRATIVTTSFGIETVRGSSLHSPETAAVRFCRALRSWPGPALLVVDGPVGPAGVAKPGIAAIAAVSDRAIRSVAVEARPRLTLFYLWSRMIVPLPFARIVIAVDEKLDVASSDRATIERIAPEVSRRLSLCAKRAAEAIGRRRDPHQTERESA